MAIEYDEKGKTYPKKGHFPGGLGGGLGSKEEVDFVEKEKNGLLEQFNTLLLVADVSLVASEETKKKDFLPPDLVTEYQDKLALRDFDKNWDLVDDIKKPSDQIKWRENVVLLRNYVVGESQDLDKEVVEWFEKMGWDMRKIDKIRSAFGDSKDLNVDVESEKGVAELNTIFENLILLANVKNYEDYEEGEKNLYPPETHKEKYEEIVGFGFDPQRKLEKGLFEYSGKIERGEIEYKEVPWKEHVERLRDFARGIENVLPKGTREWLNNFGLSNKDLKNLKELRGQDLKWHESSNRFLKKTLLDKEKAGGKEKTGLEKYFTDKKINIGEIVEERRQKQIEIEKNRKAGVGVETIQKPIRPKGITDREWEKIQQDKVWGEKTSSVNGNNWGKTLKMANEKELFESNEKANEDKIEKRKLYVGGQMFNDLFMSRFSKKEDLVIEANNRIKENGVVVPTLGEILEAEFESALQAIESKDITGWGNLDKAKKYVLDTLRIKGVVDSEKESKFNEVVVEYFVSGRWYGDFQKIYSRTGVDNFMSGAVSKLEKSLQMNHVYGLKTLGGVEGVDFENAWKMIIGVKRYLRGELGDNSVEWQDLQSFLEKSNIRSDDLMEARKRILEKNTVKNEKELYVWDQVLFDELESGTSTSNGNKEYYEARRKLTKRGFDLGKISKEVSDEEKMILLNAINVVQKNKPDENFDTVDLAKKKLMDYFGVVGGEKDKKNEKKGNKKEEKLLLEDDRAREGFFVELMGLAEVERWNEMVKQMESHPEPQRSYDFGFLRVAYDWYMHPEKIVLSQGGLARWEGVYSPILKKLGIRVDE